MLVSTRITWECLLKLYLLSFYRGERICLSNNFPGGADGTSARTAFWEVPIHAGGRKDTCVLLGPAAFYKNYGWPAQVVWEDLGMISAL